MEFSFFLGVNVCGGGRSVGIVRSRTQAMEFSFSFSECVWTSGGLFWWRC
jgi:hypothetical protein